MTRLYVVETDDNRYLGTIDLDGDHLVVRDGFVGRPHYVPLADLVSVTLAEDHDEVEPYPTESGLTNITIAYAKHNWGQT